MAEQKSSMCTHQGQNVKSWREMFGLTQLQLADKMNTTQGNISNYEGMEKIPTDKLEEFGIDIKHLKEFDRKATLTQVINQTFSGNGNNGVVNEQVNNPIEKVAELYERIIALEKENAQLRSKA